MQIVFCGSNNRVRRVSTKRAMLIIGSHRLAKHSLANTSAFAGQRREIKQDSVRDQDLFLAQKIEVSVTAGARIHDGGKVLGKIVGVTAVDERKSKGNLQSDLRLPMVLPSFQN
jgi:hypothetical protein